ncbi:MAG: phosphotriesterase [Candidatus Latescibacteria bacterium]|nr:phosphotriesterase [Candidatus Latescibacterota bacterium]
MQRRHALKTLALAAAGLGLGATPRRKKEAPVSVQTATGPISPEDLGVVLSHEHVMVDFIGADRVSRDRYDPDEVFRTALPHLKQIRDLGCRTLVECTPMFLGRDPALLRRLSEASGLHLLTNTGMYKAPYLPAYALEQSAEELAAAWTAEATKGIEGTGIRPGLIKIAVNPEAELVPIQKKIVRAAALTHLQTGLSIAAHTGPGLEVLDLLKAEGVAPGAFIWVHAQSNSDQSKCLEAARRGAWLSYDGFPATRGTEPPKIEVQLRTALDTGLGDRLLISHDAGWYHVGEPGGGTYRPYDAIFTHFLPTLKKDHPGIEKTLLVDNPRRALTPGVKGN